MIPDATVAMLAEQVCGLTIELIEVKAGAAGIADDARLVQLMMIVGATLSGAAIGAAGIDPATGKSIVLAIIDEALAS